jgi:hypothetical protein
MTNRIRDLTTDTTECPLPSTLLRYETAAIVSVNASKIIVERMDLKSIRYEFQDGQKISTKKNYLSIYLQICNSSLVHDPYTHI